jgi:hypothetical protein
MITPAVARFIRSFNHSVSFVTSDLNDMSQRTIRTVSWMPNFIPEHRK